MVMFAQEVPSSAPLVVRTKPSTKVLYGVMLVVVALQVLVLAGLVALVIWSRFMLLLAVFPLYTLQGYFMILIVREYQALLGPQLAADQTGVWVRTGQGSHPEVVFLPWQAIDGIDSTRRKGPVVRVMSRQGEGLFGQRRHWRVRTVWRRFGTPFVVDGRRSAEPSEQIAHRLQQLGTWARS